MLPIFERGHVAMIAEGGKLTGLITRVDLLDWLSNAGDVGYGMKSSDLD